MIIVEYEALKISKEEDSYHECRKCGRVLTWRSKAYWINRVAYMCRKCMIPHLVIEKLSK
jgi:predicted RNA-binding Zn-ribbon protein involved in translation (DUF1610 family)